MKIKRLAFCSLLSLLTFNLALGGQNEPMVNTKPAPVPQTQVQTQTQSTTTITDSTSMPAPENYEIRAAGDCVLNDADNSTDKIDRFQSTTLAECAIQCKSNDSCNSFIFNKLDGDCVLTSLLTCTSPRASNEQQMYFKKAQTDNVTAPSTVIDIPDNTHIAN
ncbi:MAG: hypothetical protein KBD64_00680 [Gammaproteobacteria bacterium]|nr:hypothetical protein [Gammaproteobacteria bacterium]